MGSIATRQVGVRLRVTQIIDGYDFQLGSPVAFIKSAQDIAAYPPITVDTDLDRHSILLMIFVTATAGTLAKIP
jgi:hypothetical protein